MNTTYITIPEKDFLEIIKKLDVLTEYILKEKTITPSLGDWISEEETMRLLKKKKTSLYNMRMSGELRYTKIGKTIFYSLDSINTLLREYRECL